MKFLDLTLPTPAENLACDEALLDLCEAGYDHEILRVWEPTNYFVVVGYANHTSTEVNRIECESKNVPVLRRCSGGGTVLQGPGCLNYALILRIHDTGPLHSIPAANRFIMDQNRAALASVLTPSITNLQTASIQVCGCTDLAIDNRKVSGNAQRRRKNFLLFHGTFLLNFDLSLLSALLPMPGRQPDYRRNRSHEHFLSNLNLSADRVKAALRNTWRASEMFESVPHEIITALVRDKYALKEWNLKF